MYLRFKCRRYATQITCGACESCMPHTPYGVAVFIPYKSLEAKKSGRKYAAKK